LATGTIDFFSTHGALRIGLGLAFPWWKSPYD
jgi:hypothetical protein